MPPCRLSTFWPLWRSGSPQKTLPLQLLSQLPTLSHTPQEKWVEKKELDSSSHPHGPTMSSPWTTYLDLLFEFHAVSVTLPFKLNTVVIYHPIGPLSDFFDERDLLLNSSTDDGTPLVLMTSTSPQRSCTQMNTPTSSPHSTSHSPTLLPPNWPGNPFDLVFTRSCGTSALSDTLFTTHYVWWSRCHFLSPPEIHHLPCPYTSHGHQLPQSVPLSSFLTTISDKFSLMFTVSHSVNPQLSESLQTNR